MGGGGLLGGDSDDEDNLVVKTNEECEKERYINHNFRVEHMRIKEITLTLPVVQT